MKRIVKATLVLCLFVVQTSFGHNINSSNSTTNETKVLKSEAKMRKSDHPFSDVLYILSAGTQVKTLGLQGGYYKVKYKGKIGYVNELFIQYSGIKVSEPTVTKYSENEMSTKTKKFDIIQEYDIYSRCVYNAQTDTWSDWEKEAGTIAFLNKGSKNYPVIILDLYSDIMSWFIVDVSTEASEDISRKTYFEVVDKMKKRSRIVHYIYKNGMQEFYIYRPKGMVCYKVKQK